MSLGRSWAFNFLLVTTASNFHVNKSFMKIHCIKYFAWSVPVFCLLFSVSFCVFSFFLFFLSLLLPLYLSSFPICEREGMTKLKRPCYFNLEDWHKRRSVILMENKSWNFVLSLSWTFGGVYMQEGILPRTSYWPCRNFMDFNVVWVVYQEKTAEDTCHQHKECYRFKAFQTFRSCILFL